MKIFSVESLNGQPGFHVGAEMCIGVGGSVIVITKIEDASEVDGSIMKFHAYAGDKVVAKIVGREILVTYVTAEEMDEIYAAYDIPVS